MSDLKDESIKSGSQSLYSPPRVVRMGDLTDGKGNCSAGSSTADYCAAGTSATAGYCTAGTTASPGACTDAGSTATTACTAGVTATTAACTAGTHPGA